MMGDNPVVESSDSSLASIDALSFDHVMRLLPRADIVSLSQTCKVLRLQATHNAIWRSALRRYYTPQHAAIVDDPIHAEWPYYRRVRSLDACLRRWSGDPSETLPVPTFARFPPNRSISPLFCVNAIGCNRFLVGGREGTVHLLQSPHGTQAGVATLGEFEGIPMLGLSVDIEAQTGERPIIIRGTQAMRRPCPGHCNHCRNASFSIHAHLYILVVAGGFDGTLRAWRLNQSSLALDRLPAKQLKDILSRRGIPFDDLNERPEFIARIKRYNALPLATQIAFDAHHDATVVSVSHQGE